MANRQDGGFLRDATTGALVVSGGTPYGLAIGKGGCVVPVGVRGHVGFDNVDSTATSITYRTFWPLTDSTATAVLPVLSNGQQISGVGGDAEIGNSITVACAVETSDGTVIPFTFNGAKTVTIPLNAHVVPDAPISFGAQVSANDKFSVALSLTGVWIRTYAATADATRSDSAGTTSGSATVTDASILATDVGKLVTGTGIPSNAYVGAVTAGVSFTLFSSSSFTSVNATATGSPTISVKSQVPLNLGPLANSDALTSGSGGNLTGYGSATVSGGAGSFLYGPSLLLARQHGTTRKPIVGCLTDSIFDGYQDDFHSSYYGPVARACQALGYPLVKASKGGESASQVNAPTTRRNRAALLDGCTHVIVQLGTNDQALTTGAGAGGVTTMQTRLQGIGNWIVNQLGAKAYLATVPPRTTSTDSWATTGNQTPASGSQITFLASLNQWIRSSPSPFSGVIDLEGLCSSAQDSGLWAASATTDGVHPTDAISRGALTTACQTLMAGWSV